MPNRLLKLAAEHLARLESACHFIEYQTGAA
jgi:hypothetical protein